MRPHERALVVLAAASALTLAFPAAAFTSGSAAGAAGSRAGRGPHAIQRDADDSLQRDADDSIQGDADDYVPGEVVVGYGTAELPRAAAQLSRTMGVRMVAGGSPAPNAQVLRLPTGESVSEAAARLRRVPGVVYAVPNYIAHIAGSFVPDDPGNTHERDGWMELQWNFLKTAGVDAPEAWANLIADHRAGGRGVVVAVLDTGVAYRNWRKFRKSPDFRGTRFVDPYDFVLHNRFPLDREGHGTFVASEIAEATNNDFGVTGLAYHASIMPVRVLAAGGTGDAATIARGIRYAVAHHAQVINLSLEFDLGIDAADIPDVVDAISYAHRHGVVVVAAAGNDGAPQIAYPASAPGAIAVGATTSDRCLAWYSNVGHRLDLVAHGGNDDATLPSDPDCHPARNLPPIYQLSIVNSNPRRFGYPGATYGTSMAAPEVSATAALVIASGVLGPHPSPAAVLKRLEQTADPLGNSPAPNFNYGYGLVNAGAATAPIPPTASRGS